MTTVFVYGTLKRGHGNHCLLEGQKFLGEATTPPRFRLFDLGAFPAVAQDRQHGYAIRGELYLVDADCLARLDRLEGVPRHYQRLSVPVTRQDGRRVTACIYVQQPGQTSGLWTGRVKREARHDDL
jgi:gamma-glutamylcyclotransferase (GGCT)/AIG2-like uncharacterized protein YtfP